MEKRFLFKNHRREHGTQASYIQRIIIQLIIHQQFWALEIPTGNPDVVLSARVIELSESPVNQAQKTLAVIDHYVVWLHVPMDNSLRVAEIEGL